MKNFILLSILASTICFTACGPTYVAPTPVPAAAVQSYDDYQVITDPTTGMQQVVYVDNGVSRMLDYALFMSLYNNGGFGSVRSYYTTHRTVFHDYSPSRYSTWRTQRYHQPTYSRSTPTMGRNNVVNRNNVINRTNNVGGGTGKRPIWGGGNNTTRTVVPQIRNTPTSRPIGGGGTVRPSSGWGGGSKSSGGFGGGRRGRY